MPSYDVQAIKERLCLVDLFRRDGHELKKSGSSYSCLCPFHEEKTPSCSISPEKQYFRCFGCDIGGDLIAYWQRSRGGLTFPTALAQLADLAGLGPGNSPPPSRPKPRPPASPPTPEALSTGKLKTWAQATGKLANSPKLCQKIARWRHLSPALIQWAARRHLIAYYPYGGKSRVAFIVKAYLPGSSNPVSVSHHIRLGKHSPLNPTPHQSWRYFPPKQGSWPFLIGDPETARQLFITEGQWDALALCQLLSWGVPRPFPPHICVIGLRGSGSYRLLLRHYPLNPTQQAFAFIHADAAGRQWLAPGHFIEQLTARLHAVHVFSPDQENMDLNDKLKNGLTATQLLADTPVSSPRPQLTLAELLQESS